MKKSRDCLAIKHKKITMLLVTFMVLATVSIAYSHAATLWAYVENDRVYVEAFFMGGAKVQHQRIVVLDRMGKKLLEGKTDKEGKFNFIPPIKDYMKILLLIDKAHGSDFEITKEDFQQGEALK